MGQNPPRRTGIVFWLVALFFALTPQLAAAHQTAISTLNVEIRPDQGEVDMLLVISPDDLADHLELDPNQDGFADQSELPEIKPTIAAYLKSNLQVANGDERCTPTLEEFVETGRRMASLMFRKTARCEKPLGEVTIANRVMLEAPQGYTHYSQIQLGEDIHTTVFEPGSPTYTVEVAEDGASIAEQSFWQVFVQYLWQGVLHILLGLDHVLFVICLLLAARRLRPLLAVVTSFTIAHSITLAMSALELVSLSAELVEPLIALSIAWVAVELLLEAKEAREEQAPEEQAPEAQMPEAQTKAAGPGMHLYVLTFLFGLLHGFGFSYVLRDEVGLPTDALVPALLSFNVGVEAGQIAIVAVAFPLMAWVRKKEWGRLTVKIVAAAVLLVSLYWFIERVM